jgi:hypothetical protein
MRNQVKRTVNGNGEKASCNTTQNLELNFRNEPRASSEEYENEEEYEEEEYDEEYNAEEIVVWTVLEFTANNQTVLPEDRELFNTFFNSSSRRNLADLVTAKLASHENRIQRSESQSQPQQPALPPKVIEVYKKLALYVAR